MGDAPDVPVARESADDTDRAVDDALDVVLSTAPEIRRSLAGRRGETAGENPSGETRLAADEHADRLLIDRLANVEGVGEVASEEREEAVDCGEGVSVAVDPLDGSSNLASNNPMGTIVGIYDDPLPALGRSLLAAGYVVFGPITTAVVAREGAVTAYELVDGDRQVATSDLALPDEPVVYGFGDGDDDWPEAFATFAEDVRHELKLRYGGALVADVNQVLEYGGLFAYPGLDSRPAGKLRSQFEAAPIAYVVESAGGASSDGTQSLLDREPADLHARTPVHVGNEPLIERLEAALAE